MSGDEFNNSSLTITGKSLDDCKSKLYMQYGPNYDIRNYQIKLKGGFLGFGQKEYIEVQYTLKNRSQTEHKEEFNQSKSELLKNAGIEKDTLVQAALIKNQFDELKAAMEAKLDNIAKATPVGDKHPTIQRIEDLLSENEFTLSFINNISNRIKNEFPLSDLDDFDTVQKAVVDWIGHSIFIAPKQMYVKVPHVTVIVGPTGVGKTTTVAKMAARFILDAREKQMPRPNVRMITIDRTRVGAEEQLRKYGEIMEIPVDKAESAADVKQIFETYKNTLDEIIIDTSGYSPNDYENIGKMRSILDVPGLHPDVFLAVTASTKASDLVKIIQNYETFNFSSVIITKCDETTAYGNVISVLSEKRKQVSYITDGQQVPKHFERASVVHFLTRLNDFTIDRLHIDDLFAEDK